MVTPNARRRSGAGETAIPTDPQTTELVAVWRAEPLRPGGPVRAEVAVCELEGWLARGWQTAPAPGEADGA